MTSETQVHEQTLSPGDVIADYRITAVLGQGGFGITYKAVDETLRRDVALKEYLPRQFAFRDGTGRIQPRTEADRELFEWGLTRFVDEGRALAMFRHPNIASVIRYIEQNGTAYLVMEFEAGMDLGRWLAARDRPDEERLVKGILVPVLEGLARVHDKGLLHRDIKPDNIFIRRDETPVLIDFGASRPHGPEAASKLTSIISAGYSPFEQYGSGERQGPWSDLYALGGTMYRAISGKPPVDAIARHQGAPMEPAVEVGAGRYSKRFLQAIDRALSLDIAARPQSAREFLTLLGFEPPPAPVDQATTVRADLPTTMPGRGVGASGTRGRRAMIAGAGVAAALGLAAALYLLQPGLFRFDDTAGAPTAGTDTEPSPPGPGAPVAESGAEPGADSAPAGPPDAGPGAETGAAEGPPAETTADPAVADRAPPDQGDAGAAGGEPEPDPRSETLILAGLDVSAAARSYRLDQLAGAMLEYTSLKSRFDECERERCKDLPTLLAKLTEAQRPHDWKPERLPGFEMTLTIRNPRRLDNEECPFMLDLVERINVSGTEREQVRTYCTSNGFDRVVQNAQTVN